MQLYTLAAEAGEEDAPVNLALMHLDGRGTARDEAQALYWTRKAADAAHPVALNNLGHFYQNGIGVAVDLEQARAYYRQSAELGYQLAADNLAALEAPPPSSHEVPAGPPGPLTPAYPDSKLDA